VSINQREVGGQKQKKKHGEKKDEEARKAADRIRTINPPGLDPVRSQDGTVCLQKFPSAFLVTVGITLDTW